MKLLLLFYNEFINSLTFLGLNSSKVTIYNVTHINKVFNGFGIFNDFKN